MVEKVLIRRAKKVYRWPDIYEYSDDEERSEGSLSESWESDLSTISKGDPFKMKDLDGKV